jgi:predicted RNA binding protein YcfA (HicA-like mRNA interferase family)
MLSIVFITEILLFVDVFSHGKMAPAGEDYSLVEIPEKQNNNFTTCVQVCIMYSMTSREIIKKLKRDGWELVSVTGSHHKFKHPVLSGSVTVPHPKHDFPTGTLRSIYKQAGWEWR